MLKGFSLQKSSYDFETGTVDFVVSEYQRLNVSIKTKRLEIRSIDINTDLNNFYSKLYGNSDVMKSCAWGVPFSKEKVTTQMYLWNTQAEAKNPFSTLCVNFNTENNGDFLGAIGFEPMTTWPNNCLPEDMTAHNTAELCYLYQKSSWGQGIGNEAAQSIVNGYALALQQEGYTIPPIENEEPKQLTYIYATAREDNRGSCRILEKCGLKHEDNQEIYGADRRIYWKKI
jgi:RimJ/RimL family protein N-acetyltransferase